MYSKVLKGFYLRPKAPACKFFIYLILSGINCPEMEVLGGFHLRTGVTKEFILILRIGMNRENRYSILEECIQIIYIACPTSLDLKPS